MPFFAGEKINVVDVKLYKAVDWFIGGKVDHIPATIFAGYPKLSGVYDAVRNHACRQGVVRKALKGTGLCSRGPDLH